MEGDNRDEGVEKEKGNGSRDEYVQMSFQLSPTVQQGFKLSTSRKESVDQISKK